VLDGRGTVPVSARLAGTQRVPAAAAGAAILPARRHRAACGTAVRPVEGVAEAQRAAIFLEGLARLATALEDGAEERVHDRQIGRADFELLELIGRLVEHLELEVHAAEGSGQREVVRGALGGRAIEGDHPAWPGLLAIRPLEPGQERQRRLALHRTLPGAHRLARIAGRFVRIADKAAQLYVPIVHTLALATFLGWLLIGEALLGSFRI